MAAMDKVCSRCKCLVSRTRLVELRRSDAERSYTYHEYTNGIDNSNVHNRIPCQWFICCTDEQKVQSGGPSELQYLQRLISHMSETHNELSLPNGVEYRMASIGTPFEFYAPHIVMMSQNTCRLCRLIYENMSPSMSLEWFRFAQCTWRSPGRLLVQYYEATRPQTADFLDLKTGPQLVLWFAWERRKNEAVSDETASFESQITQVRFLGQFASLLSLMPNSCTRIPQTESIRRIRQWLHDCDAHQACRAPSGLHKFGGKENFPRRLLHISGKGSHQTVKLVETKDLNLPGITYTTLSHCWGKNGVKLALLSSIHSIFKSGLSAQALPLTFRQAVQVTADIGIDYIWIDALCIIQDSAMDWSNEAPRMSGIYAQAYLNLAASASSNADGGLFRHCDFQSVGPTNFAWYALPSPNRTWLSKLDALFFDSYSFQVEHATLNDRAWVLQERLLSRRTVHFTSSQCWWDCYETRMNESHEHDIRLSVQLPQSFLTKDSWAGLVETYTKKKLTKQSDRLVAIAGLAELYASLNSIPSEDYFAGIWREDLLEQLLWKRNVNDDTNDSSWAYTAPSWSWASIAGRVVSVSFQDPWYTDSLSRDTLWQPKFRVKDIQVSCRGNSLFGQVDGGLLDVECLLYPIERENISDEERVVIPVAGQTYLEVSRHYERKLCGPGGVKTGHLTFDRTVSEFNDQPMLFVPLAHRTSSLVADLEAEERSRLWGLIIVKVSSMEENIFRRVGLLRLEEPVQQGDEPTWWHQNGFEVGLEDEFHLQEGGYRIRLV